MKCLIMKKVSDLFCIIAVLLVTLQVYNNNTIFTENSKQFSIKLCVSEMLVKTRSKKRIIKYLKNIRYYGYCQQQTFQIPGELN